MSLTTVELARARDTVAAVLEALRLATYQFAVEPGEGRWTVQVECASDRGWTSVMLELTSETLQRAQEDPLARARLQAEWARKLAACRVADGS